VVEASTTELLTDTPEDEATATPESSDKVIEHTVVKGQSLWRIVQAYFPDIESSEAINDKIDQIVQDNSIKDKNSLEIGQKLKIS
jgi:LysM repeat protein